MIPDNYFLYAFWDADKKSYYVDQNGGVAKSAQFKKLQNKPTGWKQIEVSFDTQAKYFSLVKALAVPQTFPLDGAEILRYLLYKGRGYEEVVDLVILKWNEATGVHELEYKGRLDLSKATDDPLIGVTVNAKEGGLQALVDANDGVTQEIPLDPTNPDIIKIEFDGIELFDKQNFNTYELDISPNPINATYTPFPMVWQNNEGDSVGIVHGDQSYEPTANFNPYTSTSGNYIFYSAKPITIELAGTTKFRWTSANNQSGRVVVFYYTSTSTGGITVGQTFFDQTNLTPDLIYTINWNKTINLAAGQKLFLMIGILAPALNAVTVIPEKSDISISYQTINDTSYAFALRPLHLFNQLTAKVTDNKYTFQSSWFQAHNNIVMTSGLALRGLPKAILKKSLEKAYEDYNFQYCLCMFIRNNVLNIEKRDQFYSGAGTPIFDLGNVSDFKIIVADENIVNTVKVGWPDQQYDERNGKYEYNSTNEFKLPVEVKKAELNLIGEARGDAFGMEFIRGKLNNKDTTDNKGDNESFMVNIGEQKTFTGQLEFYSDPYQLKVIGITNTDILTAGEKFTVSGTLFNNQVFTVASVASVAPFSTTGIVIFVVEPVIDEIISATLLFNIFKLKRVTYDVSPPLNLLTDTAFNIEEMTPMRRFLYWKSHFASILKQIPNDNITVQSTKKNGDLVTVLNGVTIAEKTTFRVSSLGPGFFLNYKGQFTCETPLTFYKTLTNLQAAATVKAKYNGFDIYFLPIGKMASKSYTNDAQEWELLLSAKNNLNTIHKLSQEGLYINDGMDNTLRSSPYNPVHWNYYDKQLPAGVKYKDMFDDWAHHRNDQFAVQPGYLQKWEKTETISNQFLTNGIGQLSFHVYDSNAVELSVTPLTIVSNPAVHSPAVLQQMDLNLSGFAEGCYLFTITAGSQILLISEFQSVKTVQLGTYIIDYYNSYNKLDAYWASFKPQIRVEAFWGRPIPDGSATDYEDEPKNLKILHSETFEYKTLYCGYAGPNSRLLPDYMYLKLNNILWLDRVSIEKTRITRAADSKIELNQYPGYPFCSFTVDLRKASGDQGITVNADGSQALGRLAAYTLEAELYDTDAPSGSVIQAEIEE